MTRVDVDALMRAALAPHGYPLVLYREDRVLVTRANIWGQGRTLDDALDDLVRASKATGLEER